MAATAAQLVQPLPIGPDSSLDIAWDWSQWLVTGDTIASFVIDGTPGLGLSNVQQVGQKIIAWAAPQDSPDEGTGYEVTCTVTTASTPPRVDSRTIALIVQSR